MTSRIPALAAALILASSALAVAATGKPVVYEFLAQNKSGETGTVSLVPTANGAGTIVTVIVKGAGTLAQPMHVHLGPCKNLGKVEWPLTTLQNGTSKTTLGQVPMAKLLDGSYAVNVHKSATDLATYVACADLALPST